MGPTRCNARLNPYSNPLCHPFMSRTIRPTSFWSQEERYPNITDVPAMANGKTLQRWGKNSPAMEEIMHISTYSCKGVKLTPFSKCYSIDMYLRHKYFNSDEGFLTSHLLSGVQSDLILHNFGGRLKISLQVILYEFHYNPINVSLQACSN